MEYIDFALNMAQEAGAIMRRNFTLNMAKEWKSDGSVVTESDTAINTMLITSVQKKFPDHGVLAEETSANKLGAEYVWICDPIDGTTAFAHGVATCAFALALVKDGEPLLGVIYDPFLDRMFHAEKGKGSFLNGSPIHVSNSCDLKGQVIPVSFSRRMKYQTLAVLSALYDEGAKFVKMGSSAYDAAMVACGEFAGFVFPGQKAYDCAAMKIIVTEAGGQVTDLLGHDFKLYDKRIDGLIASNGKIHSKLLKIVKQKISTN